MMTNSLPAPTRWPAPALLASLLLLAAVPAALAADPASPAGRSSPSTTQSTEQSAGHDHAIGQHAWSYAGANGPAHWGALSPAHRQCALGTRQSPIDIRDAVTQDLAPIRFDYRPSTYAVIDNGHTVQVDLPAGNAIDVEGRRYELVQFHFHRPSEERIRGRQFDMVAHLVHRDANQRLAVVAVLLENGRAQPLVQAIWDHLPSRPGVSQPASGQIDLNALLPPERTHYRYTGSLTTPPCSEEVLWMVFRQPVPISEAQLAVFSRLYPMNARPVQASGGRLITESK